MTPDSSTQAVDVDSVMARDGLVAYIETGDVWQKAKSDAARAAFVELIAALRAEIANGYVPSARLDDALARATGASAS